MGSDGFAAPLQGGHAATRCSLDGLQQAIGIVPFRRNAIQALGKAQGIHEATRLIRRSPMPGWKVRALRGVANEMADATALCTSWPCASWAVMAQASGPSASIMRP